MNITADSKGFSVYISGEKIFEFGASVLAELDKTATDREICDFYADNNKYIWKTAFGDTYMLTVNRENAVFSSSIKGKGTLGRVRFLRSINYAACGFYSPVVGPNGDVGLYKPMNNSEYGRSSFFAPQPLCYVFDMEDVDKMLGVSLVAENGKYNFDGFNYNYEKKEIFFSTDFMEYTTVDGEYNLPDVVFFEGNDRFDVLKQYSRFHYENGYIEKTEHIAEKWWRESFFCGWGDQWITAANMSKASDAAWDGEAIAENVNNEGLVLNTFDCAIAISDEVTYRRMLKKVKEKEIEYGTIIIDCKWQKTFGNMEVDEEKWPDMRAFVDEMHKNNKKVLLWLNFWSVEGLPKDECITENGTALYVDPTNPQYIKRMREIMEYLLSDREGCCNADGFKIDFVSVPAKRGLDIYEKGVAGIELVKRRAKLIYESAKKVKKDALISSQHVHPYFDDSMDVMRIGDYFCESNRAKENLYTRVGMLNAVLPEILADTDSPSAGNRHDALVYFRHSIKLGIPSIYGIDLYDSIFDDHDWKTVAELYKEYKGNL